MRITQLLTFRLLIAISAALLLLVLGLLFVTDQQVHKILDQSQTARYQKQIDAILNSLQLQEERLQATGIPDAYREDFQTTAIRNLRATYYLRSDNLSVPVIFTLEGQVIMHPNIEYGGAITHEGWDMNKVQQLQNGEFVHDHPSQSGDWHIFKLFGPWNWVVGYALPTSVKYADADRLLRILGLTFFAIVFPVGGLLSLYIRRQLRPIHEMTKAAQLMGKGELGHPLPVDQPGEMGTLAQSFANMRDLIRSELDSRHERADRIQRQQQTIMVLTRTPLARSEDPKPFLHLAAEQTEQALYCGRVSIWYFTEDKQNLKCQNSYQAEGKETALVECFTATDHSAYFETILKGEAIVADDVEKNPLTLEFCDSYLRPGGIKSLIDIPIRVSGDTRGVICIEHIGTKRSWQEDEIGFVTAVADQISQTIVRAESQTAAQEIARLRQELGNIVDSMPSILIGIDQNLLVRHWNREAEKTTGRTSEDVRGQQITSCFPQLKRQQKLLQTALNDQQIQSQRKLSWNLNGQLHYFDLTIYPLVEEMSPGAVIRIDEVTDRVHLEEMMIQTEKMLSVGGLAAGMAHEINNPLAGIMQNIQVIKNRFNSDLAKNAAIAEECGTTIMAIKAYIEKRGMASMFDALTESGNRAARIVDNMLSFSRKSESNQAPQNLHALINKTLDLAANDYDLKKNYDFRKIKIIHHEDKTLPDIPCTATEIQQVILNILKNGAQAMASDPSCITPQFTLSTYREGENAVISIDDNGPGIPEDLRRRIFEPFFTTKGVGIGTGLGLSVSYFIVREKHGGSMEVSSADRRGTCFYIRLPINGKTGVAP